VRSALFVDFDNVINGLKRLSPAYAEAFATDPARWMIWLTENLQRPDGADGDAQRRILVRRCYLNPALYRRHRIDFSRAGFEIIDCPVMTSAGKTSTDIHMVLDMIDVLQASTRYDEFIVFSADADFTPVLRKLRREDRRTTIFAAGATSASYDASADLIINLEAFIQDALGFDDDEQAGRLPDPNSLLAQAEEVIWSMVNNASRPVALPFMAKTLASRIPALPATEWAGKGSFTAMLKGLSLEPLRIDRETNELLDPRRLARPTTPPAQLRTGGQPSVSSTDRGQALPTADRLARLIADEVAAASRPVSLNRLAQLVQAQFEGIDEHWLGHGSLKRLVETLRLPGLTVKSNTLGAWVLDPERHTLKLIRTPPSSASGVSAVVGRMLATVNLPLLDPPTYRDMLDGLAIALDDKPYSPGRTAESVVRYCDERGRAIGKKQLTELLRTLVFYGFAPETSPHSVEDLAAFAVGAIRSACEREGLPVPKENQQSLWCWLTGTEDRAVG
jgi:hypothetical protein